MTGIITAIALTLGGAVYVAIVQAYRAGCRRGEKDGDLQGFCRGCMVTEERHGVGAFKYAHLNRKDRT